MTMTKKVIRANIHRYIKSGKLVAVYGAVKGVGVTVLELSDDMTAITKIRTPKYLQYSKLAPTKYLLEIEETPLPDNMRSIHRIRTLTEADTEKKRWAKTESLEDLPVSPHEEVTEEELVWAGKREGNLFCKAVLVLVSGVTAYWAYSGLSENGYYSLYWLLATAIAGWFCIVVPWKFSKAPKEEKLAQLKEYKSWLRQKASDRDLAFLTDFERSLKDYSTWKNLSPMEFEFAISLRLNNEGYSTKVTQYSNDGGIDLEGFDNHGNPVIVQVKQFNNKVGVAVVREMIGIRKNRNENPRTIIYSLLGFTRGAIDLAQKENIELRNIKAEILDV
ncbi:restriction endonuclease [Sneathiella sp. CAU 1612]|uniref:Restriction endonuclease n=1 Tax=Sneathiella sedimenti TaxID=2816034 RepID=A0ABS3F4T2_9PROT|nr:restriction endonuclease [Sneathiella sedimenti]MBO0333493.1 restriction endonuclease [Sneathiella sedimenti]